MTRNKSKILENICYTALVYGRINKKLNSKYARAEIESMLFNIIDKTSESDIKKRGKNFYISNRESNIRITVNSYTYSVITVDLLVKK